MSIKSDRYTPLEEDLAHEFAFQMACHGVRLTVDLAADIGEEPYQVTVKGVVPSDGGIENYDVEIMGEWQAGTVGLMELMDYLASGHVRIVGVS